MKPNGALIRGKYKCHQCGKSSRIACGYTRRAVMAYFVKGDEKYCRGCAKAIKLV
jgi:hypothetical protein